MQFTQDEKLAVVSTVIEIIEVDNHLHMGEIGFMEKLNKKISIDIPTVEAAEDLDSDSAIITLHQMRYKEGKLWYKLYTKRLCQMIFCTKKK